MYKKKKVSFDHIPQLSSKDKAYQRNDPRLRSFYKYDVDLETFEKVIEERKNHPVDRQLLADELTAQYEGVETSLITSKNIESLSLSNTFTVTTAHQPSLLTGPLYFIYKICSTIALADRLNEKYTDQYIVPVLILGGEDHDFEEIATANFFDESFTWKTDQVGATGRMSLDGLGLVLDQVKERLGGGEYAQSLREIISEAYAKSDTYGGFMFRFVDQLFSKYGLVIINMDNERFKLKLLPYVAQDIRERYSVKCVQKDHTLLEEAGFKSQAHAREVNIFWMNGERHRVIENNDGTYNINYQNYSEKELLTLLEERPGSISPNVILRPIFQELILPNLAYIGGGGELAYWLERRSLFAAWELPFPMLIRRDSIMIIDSRSAKWLEKNNIDPLLLFEREEQIAGKYAKEQSEIDLGLEPYREALHKIFEDIRQKAIEVDKTLEKTVLSEEAKTNKSLDYLENKLLKAEKSKNEIAIRKLTKVKSTLFPGNNGLQERYDNFIPYFLQHGPAWFDQLLRQVDPLDKDFKILIDVS